MGNDIRITNPNDTSIFDALSFKTKQDEPVIQQEQQIQEPQQDTTELQPRDQLGGLMVNNNTGNVPATGVSFSDQQPVNNDDLLEPLAVFDNNNNQLSDPNALQPLPLMDPNAGSDPADGIQPPTNKNHSTGKLIAQVEAHFIKSTLTKFSTGIIRRATVAAVSKELPEIIAKATASKAATKIAEGSADIVAKITLSATEGAAKTVSTVVAQGAGKTLQTIGVKEGSKLAGNIIKGLQKSGVEATEALTKEGLSVLAKTASGAGQKVLTKGLEEGTKIAVTKALQKSPELAGKVLTKSGEKAVQKAVTEATAKATTEVAAKGSSKFATKMGAAVPWIGAAVGTAITAWDAHDAYKKQKDPTVSTASKALAWTTVGLDVVSTVTTATGVGAPIGWAATGLSIGTSILSDYLK